MKLLAKGQEVTSQSPAARTDFDNAVGVSFSGSGGNLGQDGFGGKEMLTELAWQALSVKHVATLMNRTSF